jgi:hypothetical protein
MKKLASLAALPFLLIVLPLHAQRSSEAGIFLGASNYMGDLSPKPLAANETNFAFGAQYRYLLNPHFGLKGSVSLGKISGDDFNVPRAPVNGQPPRQWKMEAGIFEVAMQAEWHFLGKPRYNQVGLFVPQASPFISAGLGLALTEAEVIVPAHEKIRFPEPGDKSAFIVFPLSVGLRFDLTEYLLIAGEFGIRATFSDYLDGLSKSLNSQHNDYYLFAGFTFLYLIDAEITRSYRN